MEHTTNETESDVLHIDAHVRGKPYRTAKRTFNEVRRFFEEVIQARELANPTKWLNSMDDIEEEFVFGVTVGAVELVSIVTEDMTVTVSIMTGFPQPEDDLSVLLVRMLPPLADDAALTVELGFATEPVDVEGPDEDEDCPTPIPIDESDAVEEGFGV